MRFLAVATVLSFLAIPARAQQPDVAAAEALFQEGRALLEARRTAEACPKLAESHRLDPATGTLIALAACHELEGRLASAWAEFTEAAGRATREGRADRNQLATERASLLKPRLSTLTVVVSRSLEATPGAVFRRDGNPLGPGSWNVPVPVDGGEHVIDVSAPGKKAWSFAITIAPEHDRRTVHVPELEPDSARARPAVIVAQKPKTQGGKPKAWGRLEWFGMGGAALGVAALGGGAYFLNSAIAKNEKSKDDCVGNRCGPEGQANRNEALRDGRWATGFALAGTALVGTGAALFFIGRSHGKEPATVALALEPDRIGARLNGSF